MFASLVVAALGALPLFIQGVAASDCTRSYTVKSGDFCNSIGAANNVSTYQIMALNPTIDNKCGNLMPDQVICLGTKDEDCTDTYTVKPGDTCHAIATAKSIDLTVLMENNPNIDDNCYNIYYGEVLCVAADHVTPPTPDGRFDYESIATNQEPKPNTPYVPPTTPQKDNVYDVVDPSEVEDTEDLPYCDEV